MVNTYPCCYYDDPEFDYRDYWVGREYEDLAERNILKHIYKKVGKQRTFIDMGGGYGRLIDIYMPWTEQAVLVEPSSKILKQARSEANKYPNLHLVQGNAEKLVIRANSVDLIQMIRVAHHCTELKPVFEKVYQALKPQGWFILEFPNKIHALMTLKNWFAGNINFRRDYRSFDRRAQQRRSSDTIPFANHHPEQVLQWMKEVGFEINDYWSVSNLRRLNFLPSPITVKLDQKLWKLTRPIWWGPSIFVLAKKS